MIDLFQAKLSPRLREHVKDIDLETLSRVSGSRLAQTAIPNIGSIELVTGDGFAQAYDELYISMFPKRAEREGSDLIVDRLKKDEAGQRRDLAPYRIVGIRDTQGVAIGAAQFSVLMLAGGLFAVPYLQYIYIRSENRRQDMAEVLHTFILAAATKDATKEGRTVPFTLFETEPPAHGHDEASQMNATQRVQIHTKAGAVALVLRKIVTGELWSGHVQPGLEDEDPPLTLTWAIRQSPAPGRPYDVESIGKALVAAYYQSLRDEGFPAQNIALAERIMEERYDGCVFELVPLSEVNNLAGVIHHTTAP